MAFRRLWLEAPPSRGAMPFRASPAAIPKCRDQRPRSEWMLLAPQDTHPSSRPGTAVARESRNRSDASLRTHAPAKRGGHGDEFPSHENAAFRHSCWYRRSGKAIHCAFPRRPEHARCVLAVVALRCAEVSDRPQRVTFWRLPKRSKSSSTPDGNAGWISGTVRPRRYMLVIPSAFPVVSVARLARGPLHDAGPVWTILP